MHGRVHEGDGVGTLLREGVDALRMGMEASPDPSCISHLGNCKEEASEKGCSGWFCYVSSRCSPARLHVRAQAATGELSSSPSAKGFSPQQTFSPTDKQDRHFSLQF